MPFFTLFCIKPQNNTLNINKIRKIIQKVCKQLNNVVILQSQKLKGRRKWQRNKKMHVSK